MLLYNFPFLFKVISPSPSFNTPTLPPTRKQPLHIHPDTVQAGAGGGCLQLLLHHRLAGFPPRWTSSRWVVWILWQKLRFDYNKICSILLFCIYRTCGGTLCSVQTLVLPKQNIYMEQVSNNRLPRHCAVPQDPSILKFRKWLLI